MSISKSTSYGLLSVLNGCTTAAEISQQLPSVDIRSIPRALSKILKTELAD